MCGNVFLGLIFNGKYAEANLEIANKDHTFYVQVFVRKQTRDGL